MKRLARCMSCVCSAALLFVTLSVAFTVGTAAAASNSVTITFTSSTGGWSGTNGVLNTNLYRTSDPADSTNNCAVLYTPDGSGYNMEIASGEGLTTPYVLKASTSYTISFKYKVISIAGAKSALAVIAGTKAAYDSNMPKAPVDNWNNLTSDGEWHTVSTTYTTSATMAYNSYVSSSDKTNICNHLLIVANGGAGKYYIDDITVVNNSLTPDPVPVEDEHYEISDFNHKPYSDYPRGTVNNNWYVSVRFFGDTVDGNSVLGYHYGLDVQSDLIKQSNPGSGAHGAAIGTNGNDPSSTCLCYASDKPIALTPGQSYRISFKYKIVSVDEGSSISFMVQRGLYQSTWATRYTVGSAPLYPFALSDTVSDEWQDATYTFKADYTANTSYKYLQLAISGYGECLVDNIVVDTVDESEVEAFPDTSAYSVSTSGNRATVTAYSGNDTEITVPTYMLGKQIVGIDDFAFLYNTHAENITIPSSVTSIGKYAFEYASALKTVNIPKTVTSIGKLAFYGTPSLTGITVDAQNTSYKSVDGVLYNKNMTELITYPASKPDASFTVPSFVVKIADGAFANAANLTSVVLHDGITDIGKNAFEGCSGLTSFTLPTGITELKASTFRDCTSLATVNAQAGTVIGEHALYNTAISFEGGKLSSNAGNVSIADALELTKYLTGFEGSELDVAKTLAADVNADGNIDLLDAACLRRHLAGWTGYERYPFCGESDSGHSTYTNNPVTPEFVVNLNEIQTNSIKVTRDIEYDSSKEDVIIILVTGQSNSTPSTGYAREYEYYHGTNGQTAHPDRQPTEEPLRPKKGMVFSSSNAVTALTDNLDVYTLANPARGSSTMGGFTPALGTELSNATGAKVVFIQASTGAVGLHEWQKNSEDFICSCGHNYKLYPKAIDKFTRTYQSLSENYNIISTGYIYNQGEHEQGSYGQLPNTIHDDESYYNAYKAMHNDFLNDCALDFGGIFMVRSYFPNFSVGANKGDTVENSRRPTIAREGQYRAANDVSNLFVMSNFAEDMDASIHDPTNPIHYSQIVYNNAGREISKCILGYTGRMLHAEFEGIHIYNNYGTEIAVFDEGGSLISGNDEIAYAAGNERLHIAVEPLGTYITYDMAAAGPVARFVDDFGKIDWTALQNEGFSSFKLVINPPVFD